MESIGPDYFDVAGLLTEEERSVQKTVYDFVQREVAPKVGDWWLKGILPREIVPKLASLGIFGPTLPEKYGGSGISNVAYGLIMQELQRWDSGLRSFVSVQSALSMYAIYRYGSEDQRTAWLPRMARGEVIGCFGLTEPDAGSDPGALRCRARKDGSAWILSGTKRWITNGSLADVAVVWAKDDEDRIRGFLVQKGQDGFTTRDIETKASMRASITSDLILEEVRVEEDMRLPEAAGLGAPLSCLTQARYGIAFGTVGAAMDVFNEALAYTSDRRSFGEPIASKQIVQERLVDMLTRITQSQLLALRIGQMKDAGTLTYPQVSMAKRENARQALTVARMGRELLGGNGITVEYRAIRHMANLETVDTYEGTYEVHTLIVGRDVTGLGAF